MMRLPMILAVARAEVRSVRRLARYWVFALLSVAATFAIYGYYGAIHGFLSGLSATIGAIGPRFLVTAMGIYILAIFLLGLIFLAFDVRARDERERVAEVLDARPLSNLELLLGRNLGLVFMAWAPVLFVALALQAFGALARMLNWYVGVPLEPYSLVGFLLHALTVFAFWCAVIVLLSVLVRNRLVIAVAALALVAFQIWLSFRLPLHVLPAFSALFADAPMASDLAPRMSYPLGFVRQLALVVLAGGLLMVAAAFHPRRDGGSTTRRAAVGGALLVAGVLMVASVASVRSGEVDRRAAWLDAHAARAGDVGGDLRALTGSVQIEPGRQVQLDLVMQVAAPADRRLDTLLFTFNPGLTVERATAGGADVAWTHADGLLELPLATPLAPGTTTTVELVASGRPDLTFGYLDSAVDLLNSTATSANLALLGAEVGVFTDRYVALMPGLAWLPHTGSDVPSADPRTNAVDYFEVDLEVGVPPGWLVAGPGRRETVGSGDAGRFRFRPGAPLTEVGLLASEFARAATTIAGVEIEVLVHPDHDRNLRFFADAAGEIQDRVEVLLTDASRLGLPYPYGGLTLVESPTPLRGYGGGWRMDTTQAMPGVLLLRENSFTTSRFEFQFRNPQQFSDREGGIARAKVEAIERFFENDVSGGNVFLGASRNFLLFQTSARGDGALALDFVLDELVNLLLTGKRGYFSPFMFGSQLNASAGLIVQQVVTGQTESIAQAVMNTAANRPSVWDRALGASLADLEPTDDPEQALNVLALKSQAIARSILDGLGREKTAALLAGLLSRYRGGHFTTGDFEALAVELDADLQPLIGDWLHEASLPGFVTSSVVVERLADDGQGNPRYQTRVHVRNDEATPGLLRLRYAVGAEGEPLQWDLTAPVRLGGHEAAEVGVVTSTPLRQLWLRPYLSLNRNDVGLTLPQVDQEGRVDAEPLIGPRASDWQPPPTADIVVDDLDPGFSVEADDADTGVRLGGGGLAGMFAPQADMDQGLPEALATAAPRRWSRREAPLGWGRYRHTVAMVVGGSGTQRAVFATELPHAGRWRLATHLGAGVLQALGTYDLTLVAGGEPRSLDFNGAVAQAGWNTLGEFDLPAGEVRVVVSDQSSGNVVVADAIRWQALSGAE